MRTAAVSLLFLVILAAGCTAPEDEEDPLLGLCPAWVEGDATAHQLRLEAAGTARHNLTAVELGSHGRALDGFRLSVGNASLDGRVELRAFAGDRQLTIRDYRSEELQLVPFVAIESAADLDGPTFDVLLTPVTQDAEPAPGPVQLEWRLAPGTAVSATWDFEAAALYRVCGIDG